jgi:Tfp pilus assembly protein PilV
MNRRWKATSSLKLDDRGISLVEVMIGVFVLMVVALAVSSLTAKTWKTTDLSKSYTEASTEATQQLESMISAKYAGNQPSAMDPGIIAGAYSSKSTEGQYDITYVIRDGDLLPNTKSVQMNVSFTRGGIVKNIRYNYLLPLRK